jgi:DNA-binding phage protein
MASHIGPVGSDSERGLIATVGRWRDSLSPARLGVLSAELDDMAERERQLIRVLRKAIEDDPRSLNALANEADVEAAALWRFANKKVGLTLDSVAKLCDVLGLKLVQTEPETKGKRPRRKGK